MAAIAAGAIVIGAGAAVIGAGAGGTGAGVAATGVGAAGIGAGAVATGAAAIGKACKGRRSRDCHLRFLLSNCPMRFLIGLILIVAAVQVPLPAFAYSCAITPAKDSVVVKTDNASDRAVICKVDCTFKAAEGPVTISCSQQIPAGARAGTSACARPAAGRWNSSAEARAANSAAIRAGSARKPMHSCRRYFRHALFAANW